MKKFVFSLKRESRDNCMADHLAAYPRDFRHVALVRARIAVLHLLDLPRELEGRVQKERPGRQICYWAWN